MTCLEPKLLDTEIISSLFEMRLGETVNVHLYVRVRDHAYNRPDRLDVHDVQVGVSEVWG